jgi:mRNA interferase MazF
VVVSLFPFSERRVVKPRPALILSNATFNAAHPHVIAAMITTAQRSTWPSDIAIEDLKSAGLKHASIIRWKVFTIPIQNLGPRLGALSSTDRRAVEEQQVAIFGKA